MRVCFIHVLIALQCTRCLGEAAGAGADYIRLLILSSFAPWMNLLSSWSQFPQV